MSTLAPLDTLYELERGAVLPLPPALATLYGPLRFPAHPDRPHVIGNFVTTLDGVVSLNVPGRSGGGEISGFNQHDRMVMGLLRAAADAVIVGTGTLRAVPQHRWTAAYSVPRRMAPRRGSAMICMKRIYEPASVEDGYRVLVERLWPRGVSKAAARLYAWEKGLAPSDELRRWYGHDPAKWPEFQARYERDLAAPEARAILDALAERARQGTITLLYATRDGAISNAAVLQQVLTQRLAGQAREE